MKTLAIVGNGYSAGAYRHLISWHDDILRMNEWITRGPETLAGLTPTILLGYGKRLERPPTAFAGEYWINNANSKLPTTDYEYILHAAAGRPVYLITHAFQARIDRAVYAIRASRYEGGEDVPSCGGTAGLKAVAMAIERQRWNHITLFGFDAVSAAAGGIIDGRGKASTADLPVHDMAAEKQLLARLVDTGEWPIAEGPVPSVEWVGRPQGV